jgi:cytochrome P450
MTVEFDPWSETFQADPAKVFEELRTQCPVAHRGTPAPFYAVSRHEDVQALMRDTALWSSWDGPGLSYDQHEPVHSVLVSTDPPQHSGERRLITKAFRPSTIAELEDDIQKLINDVVAGFAGAGSGDFAQDLAVPVPLVVMCWLLGCDPADVPKLRRWVVEFASSVYLPTGHNDPDMLETVTEFGEYFGPIVARRRAVIEAGEEHPDDLLTNLITAEEDGVTLSDAQILGFIVFLLTAGSATTTLLIGNVLYRLLQHPDQLAIVRSDPATLDSAIEESLRFDAPVHGLFRTNTRATCLQGVDIPEKSKVVALFASANRDPSRWTDPDTFDITRDKNDLRKHFAFGFGIHYCLGAPLARLEARCALRATLRELPNLRLTDPPTQTRAAVLHGFENLPIAWDPR